LQQILQGEFKLTLNKSLNKLSSKLSKIKNTSNNHKTSQFNKKRLKSTEALFTIKSTFYALRPSIRAIDSK